MLTLPLISSQYCSSKYAGVPFKPFSLTVTEPITDLEKTHTTSKTGNQILRDLTPVLEINRGFNFFKNLSHKYRKKIFAIEPFTPT